MAKHPAEVFGFRVEVRSAAVEQCRAAYCCPFRKDHKCIKQSRLIDFPMGVCSVQYGADVVSICPCRFLDSMTVFYDIAQHYFGGLHDLLLFEEISVPGAGHLGRFDYVLARHKPLSREIEDFVVIEFQSGQTTSTGKLVRALDEYMQGQDVTDRSYAFGLNQADIWKRAFTQVLTKGIAMERWGHKVYWVVQDTVYENLLTRYHLHGMGYRREDATVFSVYDLQPDGERYELVHVRWESSSVDALFDAFRDNFEVPAKEAFVRKLQARVDASLSLRLDVE